MTVQVSEDVVRLDLDAWTAIVAGADPEGLAAVTQVDGMAAAVAATRSPEAMLEIDISAPGGCFRHLGWIGSGVLALWITGREGRERGLGRLAGLPVDALPASLARLVGLAPRQAAGRAGHLVDPAALDGWFDDDAAVRRDALARFDADRGWRLGVLGAGTTPADIMVMVAADGPGGLWSFSPTDSGDQLQAEPVSATFAFRAFCGIVPALETGAET